MRYWLQGSDQKTYGPFTMEQMVTFSAQRRLSGETLVCAEGGTEWVPAAQVMGGQLVPPTIPSAPMVSQAPGAELQSLSMLIPVSVDPVALIAGYLGIFCLIVVPAPFALGTGIWALRRLRSRPSSRGRRRAWFAICAGSLVMTILAIALIAGLASKK